ncbi:MAG: type II toxin-antitoxin system VapC family toxin [Anaerolineae bacterium]|nr:type II toxin-antitoxin system VapC family toxin [Anaerolineae bacterium]
MTHLYILDTDHITLLQHNHAALIGHITKLPPENIAVTVVSAMEQIKGRLAQINRAKTPTEVVNAFARFQEAMQFYLTVPILPYDEKAAVYFTRLRKIYKSRPGTQDLRIAAIALSRQATVVTRNRQDFEIIPELSIEDWSY